MSRAAAEVGSTANSYQILAKLASGGMAEIFLARGESVAGVERYCVVKRILRDRATDVNFVRMFLDEARLAAQLQHANIAQVYDIGKLGESYFFTMEYVHGETVRALLHRALGLRRPLPIQCVLTIAAGTAAGLHHAHTRLGRDGRALGIVHRDVSPSNLMVSYDGGVKVVDFGVAKAADRSHETKSGTVKGKISYLSPEQCRGKRVDRRSDLFSLGICFWEMLTTDRLYKRATDFENMNAIVTEAPPPPSSRRAGIPPELDALVLRLLAKTPEERFETADELVEAIEDVAGRTGSMVSASALGRFMRELFGQRPEPWLELESHHELGEAVTVTSEPIPHELELPAVERVDAQLASVVDLSPPRQATESLAIEPISAAISAAPISAAPISLSAIDSIEARLASVPAGGDAMTGSGSGSAPSFAPSSAVEPTARLGKRALLGFPLAAPPPTDPGIRARALIDEPAALRSPLPGLRTPRGTPTGGARTGGAGAVLEPTDAHTQSLPSIEIVTASSGELLVPPAVARSSGTQPAVPGPRDKPITVPPGPRSQPIDVPAGPRDKPITVQPGPRSQSHQASAPHAAASMTFTASPAASGPIAASAVPARTSGIEAAVRVSGLLAIPPRRPAWPLYVVIGAAAVAGSLAMVLWMRTGEGTATRDAALGASVVSADAPAAGAMTGEPRRPPSTLSVVPIDPPAGAPAGAPAGLPAGAPAGLPAGAPAGPPIDPPAGAPVPSAGAPLPAGQPTAPAATAPVTVAAAPHKPSAGSATSSAPEPAKSTPVAKPAQDDEITRAYRADQFAKVVELCGAAPVAGERAALCLLAACHAGNDRKARKLIDAVPAARRDQLITNCKQFGVDVAAHKPGKPDARPADDCEADPMACQH